MENNLKTILTLFDAKLCKFEFFTNFLRLLFWKLQINEDIFCYVSQF